jgi:MOSC domain-containing protein YiiM
MSKGRVVALHVKPPEGGVRAVEELQAETGVGFADDKCAGRRLRQALLLSTETLHDFGYEPGQLREQVTLELPGLQNLTPGVQVRAGNVVFRIEQDCAPCGNMARNLGEEPAEFQARLAGRRGMLCTVAEGGSVRVGDEVTVLEG